MTQPQPNASPDALNVAIAWNEHVLKTSRDPKQKERVAKRLESLKAQLAAVQSKPTA